MSAECEWCGDEAPGEPGRLWHDGERWQCEACGTIHQMSVDEDDVYVGSWTCRHGVDNETTCVLCDAEEEKP